MEKSKRLILMVTAVMLLLSLTNVALALNLRYPTLRVLNTPDINQAECQTIPHVTLYFFQFAILISGILAVFQVAIAGFQYTVSVGNPALAQDAREKIISAILGVVLLLSAWIVLNTINPALVNLTFDVPSLEIKRTTLDGGGKVIRTHGPVTKCFYD